MEYHLKAYGCLCALEEFAINGIDADLGDFGSGEDEDPGSAGPYGCGNRVFTCRPSTPEVLKKYKITEEEYQQIADRLSEVLSFGTCGWCA